MNIKGTSMQGGWPARIRRGMVAILLAMAAVCGPALAQLRPALAIAIEKPGGERGDCGMADSPLHAVAKLALESGGVRVSDAAPVMLFVNPVVIPEGRTCFVNLDVSVRARENAGPVGGFRNKEGWRGILLCSTAAAGVADVDDVRQDVLNQLAQLIRTCLEQLEF